MIHQPPLGQLVRPLFSGPAASHAQTERFGPVQQGPEISGLTVEQMEVVQRVLDKHIPEIFKAGVRAGIRYERGLNPL